MFLSSEKPRVGHVAENLCLHEITVQLPGDFFNQHPQEDIAAVGVRKTFPGLEFGDLTREQRPIIRGGFETIPGDLDEEIVEILLDLFF